ncbi:hypothetical protein AUEXF2481DRAFT_43072, partial [Aureobasidium subglaciale EXF-2481]
MSAIASSTAAVSQTSASSASTSGRIRTRIHLPSSLSLHLLGVFPAGVLSGRGIGFGAFRDDAPLLTSPQR